MRLLLLASLGGAIGAGARYLVNVWALRALGASFPWATFIVNVAGSLAMGVLVALFARRFDSAPELRIFLTTGILGGFTTFSAFSADAVALFERGDMGLALAYVAGSVVLSIGALCAGLALARSLLT
jgi:CrcB protein